MIQAECRYQTGKAGYITAEEILTVKTTYDFMPHQSGTHFSLALMLEAEGYAQVTLEYSGNSLQMKVTEMSSQSITLEPIFAVVECPSCRRILQINHDYIPASFKCNYCGNEHLVIRENGYVIALNPQDQIRSLSEHVKRIVPIEKFGFTQSVEFYAKYRPGPVSLQSGNGQIPTIVYNSEKCRVMFTLEPSGYGRSYGSFIHYGRLHAPNNTPVMKWNNEDCYCWHDIDLTLPFLEGISPRTAANRGRSYLSIFDDLGKVADFSGLKDSSTQYIQYPLRFHTAIWNKYGNRLFDLFDLKNTELWSRYTQYLTECYDIRGRRIHYTPELDRVC